MNGVAGGDGCPGSETNEQYCNGQVYLKLQRLELDFELIKSNSFVSNLFSKSVAFRASLLYKTFYSFSFFEIVLLFIWQTCPNFSTWSSYQPCSKSCDGGFKVRNRVCLNGVLGDEGCIGDETEITECNTAVSWRF